MREWFILVNFPSYWEINKGEEYKTLVNSEVVVKEIVSNN